MARRPRQPRLSLVRYGAPIALAKATADDLSPWNVLAYEVELKGRVRPDGSTTELTREMFDEVIANFGRYGSEAPVVVRHADTLGGDPDDADAHAWITKLRLGSMKRGEKTVATLEGRFRWVNEATRKKVEAEQLKYGSVTVYPEIVDEETGDEVGAYLWSFSLLNNPGLVDIPAIAAARRSGGRPVALGWYYGDLDSREDVLGMLRAIFELPVTADETATLAALDQLGALAAKPEDEREGIDTDALIRSLRASLRLPALASLDDVLAEVRKSLDTFPSEMADAPSPESLSRGRAAPSHPENPTMKNALTLARDLGIAAASDDEAAEKIVALAREHVAVRTALGLATAANATEAAAKVAQLSADAAKLPAITAERDALKATEAARSKAERDEHVAAVVSANGGALKPAEAALQAFAEADFASFARTYPKASADPRVGALTRNVVPNGGATPALPSAAGAKPFEELANDLALQLRAKTPTLTFKQALQQASAALSAAQRAGGQ